MKKITILFVALAIILFAGCSSSSKTPENTVKTYLNYVKTDKYEKAVECFYFENETVSKEQLAAIAAKMRAGYAEEGKNAFTKFEILEKEIDEDNATVKVKMFYKDGTDDTETYKLRKNEKGEWLIKFDAK